MNEVSDICLYEYMRILMNILKSIIEEERTLYIPHLKTLKNRLVAAYTHCEEYEIFLFIKALRVAEYFKGKNRLLHIYWLRKANKRGTVLGFFIPCGVLGKKVKLYHRGDIIINSYSVIGEGCLLHGDNCVGNNGKDNRCPVLGKRVELGIGAKVIGDVTLADDIIIGANAVVTQSFLEPGITLVGVPARKIT